MSRCSHLLRSCLIAAGVVGASGLGASGAVQKFSFDAQVAASETDCLVIPVTHATIHRPPMVRLNVSATGPSTGTFDVDLDDPTLLDGFGFVGIGTGGELLVGFSDDTKAIGRSFSDVLPGFVEPQGLDALRTLLTSDAFVATLSGRSDTVTDVFVTCNVTHFSSGGAYGTLRITPATVPEPGVGGVALLGGLLLGTRRRARV